MHGLLASMTTMIDKSRSLGDEINIESYDQSTIAIHVFDLIQTHIRNG